MISKKMTSLRADQQDHFRMDMVQKSSFNSSLV